MKKVKVCDFIFNVREDTLDEYVINENLKSNSYLKKINLESKDIWLDLGANIGAFAISIAKRVKNVYCFEPERENFEIMKVNIKENKIDNVEIFMKVVVDDYKDTTDFYLNKKKNKGAHSILIKRGREKINVPCCNINSLITNYNINKIKMDIEGYEYFIIKNIDCWELIDEIILEFHLNVLKKEKYKEIVEILKTKFDVVDYKEDIKKNWTTIIYCKKVKK